MTLRTSLSKNELNQLIEQVEPLKSGFDILDDHLIITDENANILYANKAVEKNTGFLVNEILGKNPADLWGGQMPYEFYEKMWQIIKVEKKPFVGEVQNKKKDGTLYWQELHISPILDEQGEVRFFVGIEPNITERKEKERFQEEFVSILGHQLKTPITAIRWFIELILKDTNLTEKQKEKLKDIYQLNLSMSDLVADLLIFARVGAITQLSNEEFNLAEEIEIIINTIKRQNSRVSISFTKTGEIFPLHTNRLFVLQVFVNLISNAVEYSDKTTGKVAISLKKEDGGYLFSSENNGTSIPQEYQQKIFSKLFRAPNAKQVKPEGTGLGLFIVKMICEKLGWQVWFKSPAENEEGAIFFVRMPRS